MFKISRLTDYAVMILNCLEDDGGALSASVLSGRTGLPEPTVCKVLKMLAGGGILTSVRGARGGYALKKPIYGLNLADVISVIEGPIALTDCVEGSENRCLLENTCDMKRRWSRVNAAIVTALKDISLADMRR